MARQMNELELLDERIEQLTELVKTGSEAIENMKTALKAAEEERDRLADQRREQEPKFERVKDRECYSHISIESCGVCAIQERDIGIGMDLRRFEHNNYFHTHERAQEVVDKINFLLRLERLHDIYCPDYVPDWDDFSTFKYFVIYNPAEKRWYQTVTGVIGTYTYFSTREIAQKVCDILNAEQEKKQNEAENIT